MTTRDGSGVSSRDIELLKRCADLGHLADRIDTAYSVGSLATDSKGRVLAEGYSRELGPHWHAEAVVLHRLKEAGIVEQAHTLYASLEPCRIRKSGRQPCCDIILQCKIKRVVFIAHEPPIFVPGQGGERLEEAGIEVAHYPQLVGLVQQANAHIWPAEITS